ncbi:MAG: hypothetical protein AB7J35_07475 [Dehalococcoidia bacterium]
MCHAHNPTGCTLLRVSVRKRAAVETRTPARGIESLGLTELPVEFRHTRASDTLPWHEKDLFDRLLALQAIVEGLDVVSADAVFARYSIRRIW